VVSLVDSSVFIEVERGRLALAELLEQGGDRSVAIAAITAAELLHGVHRLRASQRRVRAEAFVESLLAALPVIPFDLLCGRTHARVGAELSRRGVTVGTHDLMIAATAIAKGFSVVTFDTRSFPRIPDLELEELTRHT
jgi:tRNA(fMet)-specific endonuclease VapC